MVAWYATERRTVTDKQLPTLPDSSQSARPKGRTARPRQPVIRHRPAEAARPVRTRGQDPLLSGKGPLALSSIHGEVAQFSGVVDRFGGKQKLGKIVPTLCVRSLRHVASGRVVEPEHWWFRLSQEWSELGLQPGDAVQFTAKVHHCTKGWVDQCLSEGDHASVRDQVVGFAGNIRSVVVTRRSPRRLDHELLLREQLQQQEARISAADQARLNLEAQVTQARLCLEAQVDQAARALAAQQRRALLAVVCALGLGFSAGRLVGWRMASPGEAASMGAAPQASSGFQLTESAVAPPGRSTP